MSVLAVLYFALFCSLSVCLSCSLFCHEHFKLIGWFSNVCYGISRFYNQWAFFWPWLFLSFTRFYFSYKRGTGHWTAVHWEVIGNLGLDWIQAMWPLARSLTRLTTWPPASVFLFHLQMEVVLILALTSVQKKKKKTLEDLGKGRQMNDRVPGFVPWRRTTFNWDPVTLLQL